LEINALEGIFFKDLIGGIYSEEKEKNQGDK